MNKLTISGLYIALLSLGLCSCRVQKTFKNMTYLADSVTAAEKIVAAYHPITIQPYDRIGVTVTALNADAARDFNVGGAAAALPAGNTGSSLTAEAASGAGAGYLVNEDGDIVFPQIGKIRVGGLTTTQIDSLIQLKLEDYIKGPIVVVELLNFRIDVLGEVNRPGSVSIPDGKVNIIQAISMVGDLTINGLRDSIMVVREKNGQREFGRVDLSSNDIYNSPYFYLQQGDMVYVRMNDNKLAGNDSKKNNRIRNLTLVFSAVTAVVILLEFLTR